VLPPNAAKQKKKKKNNVERTEKTVAVSEYELHRQISLVARSLLLVPKNWGKQNTIIKHSFNEIIIIITTKTNKHLQRPCVRCEHHNAEIERQLNTREKTEKNHFNTKHETSHNIVVVVFFFFFFCFRTFFASFVSRNFISCSRDVATSPNIHCDQSSIIGLLFFVVCFVFRL
jgi:Zn ribbon nucleic-acid-binding protein